MKSKNHISDSHLSRLLAACLLVLAGGAFAQEKAADPQGRIVRDEPAALRVQDMTMDELQQRLAEYEAGKRDDRDGYIILNQLWFNYQAQSSDLTPINWAISKVSAGQVAGVGGVR